MVYDYHLDGSSIKWPDRGKDLLHSVVTVVFTPVPANENPHMLQDPDGYIYLAERQVTDDDLQLLAILDHLRILNLEGLPITDGAVIHLKNLTSLQKLNVTNTQLSSDAIDELKAALPHCQITY